MTLEDVRLQINNITEQIRAEKASKRNQKLKELIARVESTNSELEHDLKAAPFVAFMESQKYIQTLEQEIKATGDAVNCPVTGLKVYLLLNHGGTTAKTFGKLHAGSTVTIRGTQYLLTKFDHKFDGSIVTLLAQTKTAFMTGVPITPYSGIPCSFDHRTKTLMVSTRHKMNSPEVTIEGKDYLIVNQIGNNAAYVKYELQEVV